MFTGLAFVGGNAAANVTIEVYAPDGGLTKFASFSLGPSQQTARLINDFVAGLSNQAGGYIRITSDQPIWSMEMIGSDQVLAAVPPL